jgi:RNA-directed DNA polymerase
MGFSCEEDARRVMAVLPKRFEKYGLTIHPDKTRLVPFERPSRATADAASERRGPPGTFDLLGFTHYWARARSGSWVVKRRTSGSRFHRGLKALSHWCRLNRHQSMASQHRTLSQKLLGHFAYYGITGNSNALGRFRTAATWLWKRWLSRRRRGGRMSWDRLNRFLERHPLPPARAIHSVCSPVASP